jgi:hypothetical protein
VNVEPRRRMSRDQVIGWKMTAEDADWRCCATESAIKRRERTFRSGSVAGMVFRGGMSVSGSEEGVRAVESGEVVAGGDWVRGEGGGRELVEEAMVVGRSESGVVAREQEGESSERARLARRELRNAEGGS